MKFVNTSQDDLNFTIDAYGPYVVAASGGVVEIPERIAYAVSLRGLPLDPYTEPVVAAAPIKSVPAPAQADVAPVSISYSDSKKK